MIIALQLDPALVKYNRMFRSVFFLRPFDFETDGMDVRSVREDSERTSTDWIGREGKD